MPHDEPTRTLEVREVLKPFENLDSLPALQDFSYRVVAESGFTFGEIQGRIELKTDVHYEDSASSLVTPLGEVREVVAVSDGVLTVKEMPLSLTLTLVADTEDQFDFDERIEFSFAGKKYYLDEGVGDEEEDGKPSIWFYEFTDEEGKEVSISLPYDPKMLSQIEMKIIEKDQAK